VAIDPRTLHTHYVPTAVVDPEELREHVGAAQTWQLLLSAVHVTRDTGLLDTYRGRIGQAANALFSIEGTEDDPGVREELIQLLEQHLGRTGQEPYLVVPDDETFRRMTEIASGVVAKGHHDENMNMVEGGFVPDDYGSEPVSTEPKDFKVAIVGAGMGGMDAAVKGIERGFEVEVFEKSSGVGGLWWSQRYPGVAVDTPSVLYSLSWHMTPDWSMYYPTGTEYRAYLEGIADTYQLRDRITLGTEVTRMQWLEEEQLWKLELRSVQTNETRTTRANAVITAAGHLCRPKLPHLPGRATFAGEAMHTSEWRDIDLDGKRVGVVGVGAAGVQVVSAISTKVAALTVFQRQPVWLSRNTLGDGVVSDSERWLRRHLPYFLQWSRINQFDMMNAVGPTMNIVDEDWMQTHDTSISEVNEQFRQLSLEYLAEAFADDPELRAKVTPDFPFGAKRPVRDPGDIQSSGYFWSLKQPHVHLETEELQEVVPEGIVTADGTLHELDVIIWATGQYLDFLAPYPVVGRNGTTLSDAWENYGNPRTYIGGTIPGFPNLFIADGPHTGVAMGGGGHNFIVEAMNYYAFRALQYALDHGAAAIEVSKDAYDQDFAETERLLAGLIWSHDRAANTYYRTESGRVTLPSPYLAHENWERSRRIEPEAFVLIASRTLSKV
jgi:4-hydroxyacetophenone monooxygenase